jgi:hypothetical protein
MAAGADAPQGYATGTANGYLDGMDTGRTAGAAVPVVVQRITHGIGGSGDGLKQVTTPGTRVRLTAGSTLCRRVIVQALHTNLDKVVVGSVTCVAAAGTQAVPTRRGFALGPGDWQEFEFNDLTNVYLDSVVANDGVSFVYWTHV